MNITNPTATGATSNLTAGGTLTIGANTLSVGDVYEAEIQFVLVDASGSGAPTLTIEAQLNGSNTGGHVLAVSGTNGTYTGTVISRWVVYTTGASGTLMNSTNQKGTYLSGGFTRANIENSTGTVTSAIDTTASNTLELRMRMTTAVAGFTLTVVYGMIRKLN